jgi:hypothetical protein
MQRWKFVLPAAVLMVGLVAPSTVSFGKPEEAKKTGAKCVVCHTKMGSKELNKTGQCYKEKKTLDGCQAN